ncbi:MAG: trigger factor [Desulfobacterales bacterium]
MQVTVEDISSVKKTLRVEIPREEVSREIDRAYDEVRRTARVKGFRPGKTPRSVLERMFKKEILEDVTARLLERSFLDAVRERELRVVGRPRFDAPELKPEEPLVYAATVEVAPRIGEVPFRGLKLKRPRYRVSEAEVEAHLKRMQQHLARLEPLAEPRPAAAGDVLRIDFEGFEGGKPCPETPRTENFTVKLGGRRVLPAFEEGLTGMQAGETREFPVTFPLDYENARLAGREITFRVTLREIRTEVLPPIDDDLARRIGPYTTLEELRGKIVSQLEEGYRKRVEQELNEQAFRQLLERVSFEVPEALVEAELEGILEETERAFESRNSTLEEAGLSRDSIAATYRETAVNQVKRHLLLGRIVEQEKLELPPEELERAMVEIAGRLQQPLSFVQNYYREMPEKLEALRHALLEKKAAALILETGEIEDVDPPAEGGGTQSGAAA